MLTSHTVQRPTCFLHVGAHKTGTTALQMMLAECEKTSLRGELFVPRCGRLSAEKAEGAGHHNIAWELNHDPRFNPTAGTFRGLLEEISAEFTARKTPIAVVSSEDFEYLAHRPGALERLAAGFSEIGYDTRIVLYVRSRCAYAESLYAELVKHGLACAFSEFVRRILIDGAFTFAGNWRFCFAYATLADRFAAVFGHDHLIVRPYPAEAGADPEALARDFLSILIGRSPESPPCFPIRQDDSNGARRVHPDGPEGTHEGLGIPSVGRPNASLSLGAVLQVLYAGISKTRTIIPTPSALAEEFYGENEREVTVRKFAPLDEDDRRRFLSRFQEDDERLATGYGISITDERKPRANGNAALQKRLLTAASERWDLSGCIDSREARRRLHERGDVREHEAAALLQGSEQERELALALLLRTRLRRATELAGELARNQGYLVQSTLDTLQTLSTISDDVLPLIEVHKNLGLRYAREGAFEEAMRYFQSVASRAGSVGGRFDPRSLKALAYLGDVEIDAALASLAAHFYPVDVVSEQAFPMRVTLFVAGLLDENSPSAVVLSTAEGLRERCYLVNIVSTEFGDSRGTKILQRYRDRGFSVMLAAREGNFRERVDGILRIFTEHPTHATIYMGTPMDTVMKLVSAVGVSRVQLFMNFSQEQCCGKFAFILQTLSEEQERMTYWPGKSIYIGGFVALQEEIENAEPFDRGRFEVPENALLMGTFGRLQKCSSAYFRAVEMILRAEPRAVLLLAGPGEEDEIALLREVLAEKGLEHRVRILGPRQNEVPRLLKTIDLYLDAFPMPGGQSLLEAMCAALPVVAMRRTRNKAIDPLSVGPTSSTVETLLPPGTELADAQDEEAYASIALGYLGDAAKRERDGRALRDFVRTRHAKKDWFDRLERSLQKALAVHAEAAETAVATASTSSTVMRG